MLTLVPPFPGLYFFPFLASVHSESTTFSTFLSFFLPVSLSTTATAGDHSITSTLAPSEVPTSEVDISLLTVLSMIGLELLLITADNDAADILVVLKRFGIDTTRDEYARSCCARSV